MRLVCAILLFSLSRAMAALISYDGASYEPTNFISGLNGGIGWSNAWTGANDVLNGGLGYPGLLTASNRFAVDAQPNTASTRSSFRTPATNGFGSLLRTDGRWGAAGTELWVSMLLRRENSDIGIYGGLSLFNDSIEKIYIGVPHQEDRWGMQVLILGGGIFLSERRVVKNETVLLVARLTYDATSNRVDVFVNPQPGVTPAVVNATFSVDVAHSTLNLAFNRFRIEGGSLGDAGMDELRFGETYADVTPTVSEFAAVWSAPGTNIVTRPFTNYLLLADGGGNVSNVTVSVTADNPSLLPAGSIQISGAGHERAVAFFPASGQLGQSLITATVTNASGQTLTSTFTLDVRLGGVRHFETVLNTDLKAFGLGALRDRGFGTLAVTGVVGTVTRALLYWNGPENLTVPTNNVRVRFAGNDLIGTNIGLSSDNFWTYNHSQSYRADVTPFVSGNGNYLVTNFWKSGPAPIPANVNGVSLLVFHDDGDPSNNRDVMIFDGNDANTPNPFEPTAWQTRLNGIRYLSGQALLTMHVSDGQAGTTANEGNLTINGRAFLSGQIFQGNTVPRAAGSTTPTLWDIRTEDISSFVTTGMNDLALDLPWIGQDCVSLVVATVAVPAVSQPTLSIEPGVPGFANLFWPVRPGHALFNAYETPSLSVPSWSQVSVSRVTNNGRFVVEVPAGVGSRFFRLQTP